MGTFGSYTDGSPAQSGDILLAKRGSSTVRTTAGSVADLSDAAVDDVAAALAAHEADATSVHGIANTALLATLAQQFSLFFMGQEVAHTTFATVTQINSRYFCGSRATTGSSNLSSVTMRLPGGLLGGTWTFTLFHTATTNRGIYTIETSIDGSAWSALTTVDGYAASLTQTRTTVTGLTIPGGTAFVRLTTATQNPSSSGFNGEVSALNGLRTGA